jgi:hypothetical protein
MEKALIYFSCLFCFTLAAKPSLDTLSHSDNSKKLILKSKSQTIYFFCPINFLPKEEYIQKFDKLYKKSKIQSIDSLSFMLIFFSRSTNKSKGLNVSFSDNDTMVYVNEFETYFQNFERKKIEETIVRNEIAKRYKSKFISESNLSLIIIADIFCFNNLAERIPEYENFISQLINPVYSDAEKIVKLEVALKEQQIKIDSLNIDLNNFNKQLDSLLKRIELIENPKPIDMPKPTENPKNK